MRSRPRVVRPFNATHFEPLDRRALLASSQTFIDADGDRVTVKVTGPGEAVITLSAGTSGFITDVDVTNTLNSGFSISVKKQGNGDGRVLVAGFDDLIHAFKTVSAKAADLGAGVVIRANSVSKFEIGDVHADAALDLSTAPGKSLALTARDLFGTLTIDGTTSSLKVRTTSSDTAVTADAMKSVKAELNVSGDWDVEYFGSITADRIVSASLEPREPDSKGYSFGAVKADLVESVDFVTGAGGNHGRMKSLTVDGDVNLTEIELLGIDTIKVGDDFRPDMTLFATQIMRGNNPSALAIKSITVDDEIEGDWNIFGRIDTMKVGHTGDDLNISSPEGAAHVKSITLTQEDATNDGRVELASVKTFTAKGFLRGNWDFTGLVPGGDGESITTLKALGIVSCVLGDPDIGGLAGGIRTLSTNGIEDSYIAAEFFRTFEIKAGNGFSGNVFGTDIRATGDDEDEFSIRTLKVANVFNSSNILTRFRVRDLSFGRVGSPTIQVGHQSPLTETLPNFGSTDFLDPLQSIASLTITQKFDATTPALTGLVRIHTGQLAKLDIKGRIEPANAGNPHGFMANTFGTLKFKDQTGANVAVSGDSLPLGNTPLLPAVSEDLVFRVFAV